MTTVSDILLQSLKKAGVVGVGQSALSEDYNDALADMQDMLAQWQRKRWLVWNLTDSYITSTGAQSYTIGTGQDFNIARPDRIESAFLRQTVNSVPNRVDYMLTILESREDYNRITLKTLQSQSFCIFYDSAYPVGNIFPWPVPQANTYEVHISVKTPLTLFSTFSEVINMPAEYIPALKWNLAVRLRVAYQLPIDPALVALAKDSLNLIRNANTQIPSLQMPLDIIPNSGLYNIFSDQAN